MRIDSDVSDDVITMVVRGELDLATADEFRIAGEQALSESAGSIRVELSEVTFMDSTGLGALIHLRNRAKPRPVILANPQSQVVRVLEITGLLPVFAIESTIGSGVTAPPA
jgi:anti-sigma B factor antagonist